jgi:hypothetical protein
MENNGVIFDPIYSVIRVRGGGVMGVRRSGN